jgi:hypothetical protein
VLYAAGDLCRDTARHRAAEGQQDVTEVSTALRIVLQLEGVTCQ